MPSGFYSGSELQMARPASGIPQCGACGLFKQCQSPKMEPTGKGKRRVLIVGEAPGEDEDRKNIQLIGKSGHRLSLELERLGINMRQDCWLTNALICRPPGNEIGDEKRIDYCRPNLLRTIERLKPEVIILLGGVAVRSLCNYAYAPEEVKITRWVGWRVPAQRVNAWVCPTWHPSYLLRQKDPVLDAYFREHLKAAFKLKDRPYDEVPDYSKEVKIVLDDDKVAGMIDKIRDGVVAFDYEANMLKPESKDRQIVSCSVCWNGKTIAFPWYGKVIPAMKRMLEDRNVRKVASNMKYEHRWTKAVLGVKVRGWWWDTMLAAHLLDCRRGITSIKFQAFVRLGQPKYDAQIEPFFSADNSNTPNKIKQIALEQLLPYNGLDSLLEYKVADLQRKEMGLGGCDE